MDSELRNIIQQIHDCQTQAAVVVTGAGTQALAWLFGVAGASRTMLEARVPYAAAAFQEFIGREPKKYVSRRSARLLAGSALQRAVYLAGDPDNVVGLACTATISTDYVKRGDHKAKIATWRADRISTYSLELAKGKRSRSGEEKIVSSLIVAALADACGLDHTIDLKLVGGDRLEISHIKTGTWVEAVAEGKQPFVAIHRDGRIKTDGVNPQQLLSGSFNPLHVGHIEMVEATKTFTGRPVAFELSVVNVAKPPLPTQVALERLTQFTGRHPVYITTAPTFIEKIRLFPNTTFVVGFDTAKRVYDPRFYHDSRDEMNQSLNELRQRGGRFLVAGRLGDDGRFYIGEDLEPPAEFADLFVSLPATLFRRDISSTEIRRGASLSS